MDKFIAKRANEYHLPSNILQIASLAKNDYDQNKIDATLGMFFNEEKILGTSEYIVDTLKTYIADDLSYSSTLGSLEYKNAVLKWLFKDKVEDFKQKYFIPFGATLGGTGALYIAFKSYLEENQTILLPNIMWNNYQAICYESKIKFTTYNLFKNNKLDIDNIIEQIKKISLVQDKILLLINDPCHNPSGYCIKKVEFEELFTKIEKLNLKISIIFDIAYIDYSLENNMYPLFDLLINNNYNFFKLFAFSCSKSFNVYALRCGALFALCNQQEEKENLENAIMERVNGVYSCPPSATLKCMSLALNEKHEQLKENILKNYFILQKRGQTAVELLDIYKVNHLPYDKGFFITIKVNDAKELFTKLINEHVYLIPLDHHHLRISLSSLKLEEIERLVKIIAKSI